MEKSCTYILYITSISEFYINKKLLIWSSTLQMYTCGSWEGNSSVSASFSSSSVGQTTEDIRNSCVVVEIRSTCSSNVFSLKSMGTSGGEPVHRGLQLWWLFQSGRCPIWRTEHFPWLVCRKTLSRTSWHVHPSTWESITFRSTLVLLKT